MASTHHVKEFIFMYYFYIFFLHLHNYVFCAKHSIDTFVYSGCSQDQYQPGSSYNVNLNSILTSSVTSSSSSLYNKFSVTNTDSPVYGLYQCRGDLALTDCSNCIRNAVAQLNLVCVNSRGGRLQLEGCFVRYENGDFLGMADTSMAYKSCSKSSSSDVDFFNKRDDVLGDLKNGDGFKVSSVSLVQGYAQCFGDLAQTDCSVCLTEAVQRLKSDCGSALAGDVYLSQCYARYWAAGYYAHIDQDVSKEDQIGKTVAIIAGIVAGVALLVVLMSVLRRAL